MFTSFAKFLAQQLGSPYAFFAALFVIIFWIIGGLIFSFSSFWHLIINSFTTIITFLMVFVIQNTQNRETLAIQLKLDEMIRSMKGAHKKLLDIEDVSDEELEAAL